MKEPTLDEARGQAIKAGTYFGRVLEHFDQGYIAVRVGDVTLVVARGKAAEKLTNLVNGSKLGPKGPGVEKAPARDRLNVTLIPRYHEPAEEWANRPAHIHLHVLEDVTLGRRKRKSGECLCTKRRGSRERAPRPGETAICPECRKVAEENALAWSLD